MSIRIEDGTIFLEGRISAEDSETLLLALQDRPDAVVSVAKVQKIHLAALQILLALRPTILGTPATPFLSRYIFGS